MRKSYSIDKDGNTPLMIAAQSGHLNICQMLVDQSVSLDCRNHTGKTAIDLAEQAGHRSICNVINSSKFSQVGSHITPSHMEAVLLEKPVPEPAQPDFIIDIEGLAITVTDDWESDDQSSAPEQDEETISRASNVQQKISKHKPINNDTDWSDIDLVIPVAHRRTNKTKDLASIRLALENCFSIGYTTKLKINGSVESYLRKKNPEITRIITQAIQDHGYPVFDTELVTNFDGPPLTAEEDQSIEQILALVKESQTNTINLSWWHQSINKFDLLDKSSEQSIGQKMDSSLISLARQLCQLSDISWSQIYGLTNVVTTSDLDESKRQGNDI